MRCLGDIGHSSRPIFHGSLTRYRHSLIAVAFWNLVGAGLFGFMDSMQSQVDATAHALLVVGSLVFILLAVRSAVARRWRSTVVLLAFAAAFWLWYANTDELPREMIPYFPHITTLVVLAFASQRLRMPAADGKIWRRSGK